MARKQPNNQQQLEKARIQLITRAWKDPAFKAKLLKNPKATIEELGYSLPRGVEMRVIEDKANTITLVLPAHPPKTSREMTDEELGLLAAGGNAAVGQGVQSDFDASR